MYSAYRIQYAKRTVNSMRTTEAFVVGQRVPLSSGNVTRGQITQVLVRPAGANSRIFQLPP